MFSPYLCIKSGNDYSIFSGGEQLFSLSGGNYSSDLPSLTFHPVVKSTLDGSTESELIFDLPQKEEYQVEFDGESSEATFTGDNAFASVEYEGNGSVYFSEGGNQMKICQAQGNYTVNLSNLGEDDAALVQISSLESETATFNQTNDGILVKADQLNRINILSNSIDSESSVEVSTEKASILIRDIPNDTAGSFQVFVSENDDGNYNKMIAESKILRTQASKTDENKTVLIVALLAGGGLLFIAAAVFLYKRKRA